jgi:hypothetical protein
MRGGYQYMTNEVFIAWKASRRYSNRCTFDSHAPTQVRRFVSHALCVGYLDDQAIGSAFQRKVHRDVTAVQQLPRVVDSSMYIEHFINLV